MVKKILISACVIFILNGFSLNAQTNQDGSMPQFLFPEFIKGEIRLKNGQKQYAMLNFNTVSEKMTYKQGEQIFDMIDIGRVDTVFLYKSRFVPVGEVFYEVLVKGEMPLFVQHKGTLLPPGKPVGYGGTSQVSNSKYMSSVGLSSGYYNLKLPADFEVKVDPVFWISSNGEMVSFMSERQFLKLFSEKGSELKKFIKQYHIKFDNIPDVIKLVAFLNKN